MKAPPGLVGVGPEGTATMQVSITYPPATYYYMPYLAPFLLKGHLEAATGYRVVTDDANIRFFHDVWTGAIETGEVGTDSRVRLGLEYLRAHGKQAWRMLQDFDTYRSATDVAWASRTLKFADLVMAYDLRGHGLASPVPQGDDGWPDLVDRLEGTLVGRWTAHDVRAGRFRDMDVVCVSVAYLEQLTPALLLARLLKRHQPATRIVFGGNAITHIRREVLGDDVSFWPDLDFAVPFQGEALLTALLDALANGGDPTAIDGIAHRRPGFDPESQGPEVEPLGDAIVYRRAAPQTAPPAGPPDFTDLTHLYPTPEPVYPLLTSKGCYWGKCTFCTHHEGYGDGYFRLGSDALDGALNSIARVDGSYLYFVDEAIPPREINALAGRLAAVRAGSTRTPFKWTAEARVDKPMLTDAAVRSLVDSGCVLMVNGVEAGSQRVVDLMKKGISLVDVERHAELLRAAGIPVGWMFFIGFPGETEDEARATFEMIRRNRANISFASVGTFSLERDSPIWNDAATYHINLLEAEVPYALSQNYTRTDELLHADDDESTGAGRQRIRLERQLAALHADFPDLDPVFQRAVDRSLALFLADAGAGGHTPSDPPASEFWSPSLARTVHVDLNSWKMRVAP